jgi:hypothetical protein
MVLTPEACARISDNPLFCYVERPVMWCCRSLLNQVTGIGGGDCT